MFELRRNRTSYHKEISDENDIESDLSLVQEQDDETSKISEEIKDTNTEHTKTNYEEDTTGTDSSYYDDSEDEKDYQDNVTLRELILNIAQMSLYAMDVFSDTFLAISYAVQHKYIFAGLTLAVVYIAAGIDAYFNRSELKRENPNYIYRYIFTLVLNIRGLDIYKNLVGMKLELYRRSNPKKETQEDFFDRNFRVANLKMHEGLFEACPQLLLQLYIMLVAVEASVNFTLVVQIMSVFISLTSLAMTFVTGDKARRLYEHECDKFSNWGLGLQFFWIFPITASRILSLSCLASIYPTLSTSCFTIHCLAAFVYLRLSQPYTTFGALVAAIRIFLTPYEPIEEYDDEVSTRLCHSHLVHFVGNIAAIAIWAARTDLRRQWFSIYVSILVFFGLGFIVGVSSLVVLLKYKKDCFVQDDETESKMDRRMKPFVDYIQWICSKIGKGCKKA